MGQYCSYQPLTVWDKITVVLYRTGIVLSTVIIVAVAYFLLNPSLHLDGDTKSLKAAVMLIALYISIGLSVFCIHLYVKRYKRNLIILYLISTVCLAALFSAGSGDVLYAFLNKPYGPLLLIPLSGCLGFIAAKEAFCFKLFEGYIVALAMPFYLFILSVGRMSGGFASYGLSAIAFVLAVFTARKVFMPIHCDIGDKSAYK